MQFHYLLFLAALWYLLPLLGASPFTPPEHGVLHARGNKIAGSSKSAGKQGALPRRNAYMLFQILKEFEKTWGDEPDWPTHLILWIDGDETNGAVKLDVQHADRNANYAFLKYVEYLKGKDVEAPEAQQTYGLKEHIGRTSVSNIDLMNQNVKGTPSILMDAIRQNPVYRTGPANRNKLNTCHNVLERIVLLTEGLAISERSQKWIQNYNTWVSEHAGDSYNIQCEIRYISKYGGWTEDHDHHTKFKKNFTTGACAERRLKRDLACPLPTESTNAKANVPEVAASNRLSKLPDDALSIVSTGDSTAKPGPPATVKDSRRYSYLSGWHVKFMFHIG